MPAAPLNLRGLVAPVFTPVRPDGSLDLDRVEAQADQLLQQGVVGAFVCGTTGEGPSFSVTERRQLTERWCGATRGRMPIIVHVGHTSISDARDLAVHAQRAGAAAVAALPPFYFKPSNIDDLTLWCADIASSAPRLPFYYYHIPSLTGVRLPMADFLRASERRVPTLAGLKFSDDDLADFGRCVTTFGDQFDLFFGVDEMLLPALSVGARAAVGSTYNFAAAIYRRMIAAFEQGDLSSARQSQSQSRAIVAVFQKHGGIPAMKATMGLTGLDCGPCQPPLRSLDTRQVEALRADLEAVGFFAVTRPGGPEGR
jgi:N-acetylneuraminate lyase